MPHLLQPGERHFGSSYSKSNKPEACHSQHETRIFLGHLILRNESPSWRRQPGSGSLYPDTSSELCYCLWEPQLSPNCHPPGGAEFPLWPVSWAVLLHTPLPCCQPLFQLLPLGAPFCSGDQSDSHRAKPHGSHGDATVQGSRWMDYLSTELCGPTLLHVEQQCPTFLAPGTCFMEDNFFPWTGGWGEQFLDDSSTLHITLVIQFLLLLHQLHFRSSGVRSQRLGFSYTAEPRGHGSKKRVDWLTGGWQGDSVIELCYSRCGPWTGGTGITRESIKNAESQASAQTFWIRKSFEPDSQEIYMTIKERDELV